MSGHKILRTIWQMKWLIIVTILVFLGVAAGVTMVLPETYQATATIRVMPGEQDTTDREQQPISSYSQVQSSQALARTYTELFKSPSGFQTAVEQGDLSVSPGYLRATTKVQWVEATDLIQVQVTGEDPLETSSSANLLAQTFIEEKPADSNEQLMVADPATPPRSKAEPDFRTNLSLALLLGTIVGVAAALLLGRFRGYVSSTEEIEELVEAPVLGSLPRVRKGTKDPRKSAAFADATSNLRANLDLAFDDGSSEEALLVTSALPGEGKTTVSCALAASYARAGREALVVDTVLGKPRVHDYFSVSNERGFSDALAEELEPTHESLPTLEETPKLTVLTGGKIPPNPIDLLSSDRTRKLIRFLRERFDAVILDSPPAFPLADASVLGSQADGVLLVVDTKKVRRQDLLRAVRQLRDGKGRILGVVLNRVPEKKVARYS